MRFIGCKRLLLENIRDVIRKNAPDARTFCDVFSGTATVARYFKQDYEVYSNDLLYFSYVLQRATVENDEIPSFAELAKICNIDDPIAYLNSLEEDKLAELPVERRFFQNNYSPVGGRMYLNELNALRVDYARNEIESWREMGALGDDEYFYLLACIIEGIPFVSNTSGTYGAFHKEWERRSYKKFELQRLPVTTNGKNNKCFNIDGVELVGRISGDVLYIDPPYNQRQYLPNYHVLETAAKYDSPTLRGVTGQRDYENTKSDFCSKAKALSAFEKLISAANFTHIVLSYSTDGIMATDDILAILSRYCLSESIEVHKVPYRRYKSRNATIEEELKELIIYARKK